MLTLSTVPLAYIQSAFHKTKRNKQSKNQESSCPEGSTGQSSEDVSWIRSLVFSMSPVCTTLFLRPLEWLPRKGASKGPNSLAGSVPFTPAHLTVSNRTGNNWKETSEMRTGRCSCYEKGNNRTRGGRDDADPSIPSVLSVSFQ